MPLFKKKDPLPEWAFFFTKKDELTRFKRDVVAAFAEHAVDVKIEDGWIRPRAGGDTQWGITNIGQRCAAAPPDQWPELIRAHVATALTAAHPNRATIDTFEAATPALRARFWDEDSVPEPSDQLCIRRHIPGLATMLMLSEGQTARSVHADEMKRWNVDPKTIFNRALTNVWRNEQTEVHPIDLGDGLELKFVEGRSIYASALALMLDKIGGTLGPHGSLVTMPTRQLVITLPIHDKSFLPGIGKILYATTDMYNEGPGACSERLWWRTPEAKFIELPYEIRDNEVALMPPEAFNEFVEGLVS